MKKMAPPGRRARSHALPPDADPFDTPGRRPIDEGWSRTALAVVRMAGVVLWSALCIPLQALCLVLPGEAKVLFPRLYWRGMCFCIGLSLREVRLAGSDPSGRPVVYVANHSSWLDILVLGALLPAAFVSKGEVRSWPAIGLIARLGRTVFVERRRVTTGRERDQMRERLAGGSNLILFPEGTSSDGTRVLPFRPTFFAAAATFTTGAGAPVAPIVCPIALAYDRVGFLPAGRASRALFAWYADMDLLPHAWRLLRQRGLRASVLHAPAIDPGDFADRKALSAAVWKVVADGAATLRQNREPVLVGVVPAAADAAYA
ncbi:MAG: 1-acyl-sn-glycerol-3-phosphate acyltransferase [Rhodospirillales bacterium]|nr:1-acyl-sn-glycerol-3-phosphate acyltransferase [Rhodospirillales bacterium]